MGNELIFNLLSINTFSTKKIRFIFFSQFPRQLSGIKNFSDDCKQSLSFIRISSRTTRFDAETLESQTDWQTAGVRRAALYFRSTHRASDILLNQSGPRASAISASLNKCKHMFVHWEASDVSALTAHTVIYIAILHLADMNICNCELFWG